MKESVLNLFRYIVQSCYIRLFRRRIHNFDRSLKPGLSALVCCINEEYSIPYCLESLTGFSQQVVCIDNGSDDRTFERMTEFKNAHQHHMDIVVLKAEGITLKEARNKGLELVNRKWLLNLGGDFIFHTDGINDFNKSVAKLLKGNFYSTYRLGMINLYGDLHHTYKDIPPYLLGEHYLVKYGLDIEFREKNKFDYLYIPWYYLKRIYRKTAFFHMDGLKSDERLIYRNCYFEWRQIVNNESDVEKKEKLRDFSTFTDLWREQLFGVSEGPGLKFRFNRQLAVFHYRSFDEMKFDDYPQIIKRLINYGKERFKVIYKDGKPFSRVDNEDTELIDYKPSKEDLEWDLDEYYRKYQEKAYLQTIKEKMLKK